MRLLSCLTVALVLALAGAPPARADDPAGAHGFGLTAIEGDPLPLARYRGRPILVANTASLCGYTYQYAALQRLWEAYRGRGLVVIGVPSDDFAQELATKGEVKAFCEGNFGLDFPLSEPVHVTGSRAHPLFAWLRAELGPKAAPRWNFYKYLIGPDGGAVAVWPSSVEPDGPKIRAAIEALLPAS